VWAWLERSAFVIREAKRLPVMRRVDDPFEWNDMSEVMYTCPRCGEFIEQRTPWLKCQGDDCPYKIKLVKAQHAERIHNYVEGNEDFTDVDALSAVYIGSAILLTATLLAAAIIITTGLFV
jgi:DNA-directed RNA polymerase subunit RPC12/RpoP